MARAIDVDRVKRAIRKNKEKIVISCKQKYVPLSLIYEILNKAPTLTPTNEWVSVEERLPEKHSEYIVCACDEGEPIDERIWGDAVVICADYYDGAFTWYEGATEYDISDIVTHWMSLPEPPDRRPPEGEA